jgi:single-strand DNA-binding protein
MNKTILLGRLTKDPECRYTEGNEPMAVCRFNIAVDRRGKEKAADFPSCVAFGKNAENISKYFKKGNKIALIGHIQTGSYEGKNGKVYTTDVIVDEWEFVESAGTKEETPATDENGFANIPDGIDELPFA